MNHLGRWLTALIDGELDLQERDRVLNHLAGCQPCLSEANAMRALKRRLTSLGEPESDDAIASRLIDLGRSDQVLSAATRYQAGQVTVDGQPLRQRVFGQAWGIAAGAAGSVVVAIGVAAFMLGSSSAAPAVPKVVPSVDSYLLQHAYDAGEEPAGSATPAPGSNGGTVPWNTGSQGSGVAASQAGQGSSPTSVTSPDPVTPAVASPVPSPGSTGRPASQSPGPDPAHHSHG